MNRSIWLAAAIERLSQKGFNLVGIATRKRFDAGAPEGHRLIDVMPGAKSAVVIGAGGRKLWQKITGQPDTAPSPDLVESPRSASNHSREPFPGAGPDPIDHYTRRALAEETALFATAFPDARAEALFPFGDSGATVSFVRLAEEAGLGTSDTLLQLLLHPEFGPWVSLRACLLTDIELPARGPVGDFQPCHGCPRPCLDVCPAEVLAPSGWDHRACGEYRSSDGNCLEGCAPRMACPVGATHRYGPSEMVHRQTASLRLLRSNRGNR